MKTSRFRTEAGVWRRLSSRLIRLVATNGDLATDDPSYPWIATSRQVRSLADENQARRLVGILTRACDGQIVNSLLRAFDRCYIHPAWSRRMRSNSQDRADVEQVFSKYLRSLEAADVALASAASPLRAMPPGSSSISCSRRSWPMGRL